MNQVKGIELPNPFVFADGTKVGGIGDWERRRSEILELVVELEYGGMPPKPRSTRFELLHSVDSAICEDDRYQTLRITVDAEPEFSFLLNLLIPAGEGPFPVVLTGDSCWKYANDAVLKEVIQRGCILAQFNRVEIAMDDYSSERTSGIYKIYKDGSYGAISAWTWGYHRCVDVLGEMDFVDESKIAIVGHSRGGKATLLAGATDERIALTCANDSGLGGAGSFYHQGDGSETLADILHHFPYWFGPQMPHFIGRQQELPFDQHFLKSLIAPRALLTTEALGDLWANPSGTWQIHQAAEEVYRFLGAEERIGIWYREGGHKHSMADWIAFLDFMEFQFTGRKPNCSYRENPCPGLPKSFSWSSPK